MIYVLKKIKNDKPYSFFNRTFTDMNEAITELNKWMEFDASLLQYELEEENILYTISIDEYEAKIIKIETSKENIEVLKKSMTVTDIKPEEYLELKKQVRNILDRSKQTEIYKYVLEGYDEFTLPEIKDDKYHVIAYKNEVLLEQNILKTKMNFISVEESENNIYQEFFNFAINVGECLNIKNKKHALVVKPDKKVMGRCYIYQKKKKLCTVILYPASTKEIFIK